MNHPSNHYYGDVSNLNAPYDSVALQGVGAVTWDGKTLPSVGYPWRVASNDTLEMQFRFNAEMAKRDMCPLLVDGELGPRSCGALFLLDGVPAPSGAVATCSQHAGEEPKVCPGGIVNEPAPAPAPVVPVKPKSAGIPVWVWGLGLGVVAVGAAMMLKKKRR